MQAPPTRAPKAAASLLRTGCWTIDDTDSSSDDDECLRAANPADAYLEEWNLYVNTHEAVPDGMGIVQWWGVCIITLFLTLISHSHFTVVWRTLPNMVVSRARLPGHYGLLRFK